jgi:P-type E1-E2 ATPase
VTVDGEVVAAALVDERLRSSWPDALAHLHRLGLGSVVMTGDRAERARATAVHRVLAGMTPEAKLEHVRRLQADGRRVLFVGDGVNDAAAMAASDASVGVATGAELAAEVGDVTWYGHDLRAVAWAVETARATVRTIRANLLFAAFYNVAGIALAAAGVLHPVAAAVLMTCSSLVVTWRAIGGLQEEQQEAVGRAAAVRPPGPDLEEAPA